MTANEKCRYDLENLPISEATRKGLTPENINYIGAVGRMLSLQDEVYEEQFDKIVGLLKKINERLDKIDKKLLDHEKRIRALESKLLRYTA
jgi:hypothetical protein